MRKANLAVTPGYSAPELHFSDAKALGPLCDVFSLAAVLYYAVTGRHPINVIARGLGDIMPPAAAPVHRNRFACKNLPSCHYRSHLSRCFLERAPNKIRSEAVGRLPPAKSSSRSERWVRPSCSSAPIHSAQRSEANKSGSWVLSRSFYCWRCISLILRRYCPRQGAVTGYSDHCAPVRGAPSSSSAFC